MNCCGVLSLHFVLLGHHQLFFFISFLILNCFLFLVLVFLFSFSWFFPVQYVPGRSIHNRLADYGAFSEDVVRKYTRQVWRSEERGLNQ